MDLIALLGEPRRGLAILCGVASVAAAVFVWLNAGPATAAAATGLLAAAAACSVPAARAALGPGLWWLLAALSLATAGIYVGYVV